MTPDSTAPAGLVGTAPVFLRILSVVPTLAEADGVVLLTGETGTGKDLVAHAIHDLGPRRGHPFVAVNCGALVDSLVESELFGSERGAYTDAHARRPGLVAEAEHGTLFLDEVEALTPHAQVVLLRLLQERTVRPLGSTSESRVDLRFIAATNVELHDLVKAGQFRSDLYYRLCVFSIVLPSLRQRREDILPLAWHLIAKHQRGAGKPPELSPDAAAALLAYDWPGNVRELESAVLRALTVVKDRDIAVEDLHLPDMPLLCAAQASREPRKPYQEQKRRVLEAFERQYLVRIMTEHRGNVTRAARAAGKERRELGKMLKRSGVDPQQFVG